MFERLFAESGLSLDRLKALLAVAAAGSIVKATGGDPIKQSQYSRQIKELENFFRIKLVERHGRGIRLTTNGKELARISRFFLLGLSNFQRGCLTEEQTFCIGAGATVAQRFLLPIVASQTPARSDTRYIVAILTDDEIERRLHDLTLDFGIVTRPALSRPLQLKEVGIWRLNLWVPKALLKFDSVAIEAFKDGVLPLALASKELPDCAPDLFPDQSCRLDCENFLQAQAALERQQLASLLPDYLADEMDSKRYRRIRIPGIESLTLHHRLAWNPRLLRLNPHAIRRRDLLITALSAQMKTRES
jgi:DNA-binding transcriptional LysR family regulator